MIYTSSFFHYSGPNGVSIAAKSPDWFQGDHCRILAPPLYLVYNYKKHQDETFYRILYHNKVLARLNPADVYSMLDGKVLLCYEQPGDFCHRRLVAEWFLSELGVMVPEWSATINAE